MTTRVLLVRHGATEASAEDRFAGDVDVLLSKVGREQAGRLAERLAGRTFVAAYASPKRRTMETARILVAPHRALEVVPEQALREISHGRWEGRPRSEVEQLYPEEYARWESDPFSFAPEGGETGLAVTARALPALLRIVAAHRDGEVLVVSHKATIRLLLSSFLGFDPRNYRDRLEQSPASLNVLDFKSLDRPRLALFNDTSHYEADPSRLPGVPTARLSRWWDAPSGAGRPDSGKRAGRPAKSAARKGTGKKGRPGGPARAK